MRSSSISLSVISDHRDLAAVVASPPSSAAPPPTPDGDPPCEPTDPDEPTLGALIESLVGPLPQPIASRLGTERCAAPERAAAAAPAGLGVRLVLACALPDVVTSLDQRSTTACRNLAWPLG